MIPKEVWLCDIPQSTKGLTESAVSDDMEANMNKL